MITAYLQQHRFKPEVITAKNKELINDAIWIDLLFPTLEEEHWLEKILGLNIPTRDEMQGIEPSSRLYKNKGSIYMTAHMIAKSDTTSPASEAVTLILRHDKLITVRYIEPLAFALFISQLPQLSHESIQAIQLIIILLETWLDRLSDITERIGRELDEYSQTIFRTQSSEKFKIDYKQLLQELGSNGDLNAKAWESLVSFNRLSGFLGQNVSGKINDELLSRLNALSKDINALSDQAKFLTSKVNFLLDATLGMVNIEQNNIIKIFSIAAVIFLPPTLIASVFGMNFKLMPGLSWHYGYPISICLMLLSGWLPYKYFKIKKWL